MDQKFWIGVASADDVARGRAGGFMQLCNGKEGPLRRIRLGDGIAYYSPAQVMRGADGLQSFTAIGAVTASAPYPFDMGGFVPHRRDVSWAVPEPARIRSPLDVLTFTKGRQSWGAAFRFGILQIDEIDSALIASAMAVPLPFGPLQAHMMVA